ncbi:MAG: carboxypeptidase-like regulatory domain-containing protein [Bacteroidales bacterium]|nr:carboxypeptidase-like regulatory domain-containing protein [Bacteroidales bacterium]
MNFPKSRLYLIFVLFSFLFLATIIGRGQNTSFIINGIVADSITHEPIEQVNIKLKDTKGGTSSDELGNFRLGVSQLPIILEFSHVSYQTQILKLNYPPERQIIVKLKPKTEKLPELVVTAQKIDTIYKDLLYSVLDYELTDSGIMLLIYKGNLTNAELLYTDFDGNKIIDLPVLPGKPLALFKDCLNNIHILTRTRAYQLYFENKKIKLMPGQDIDDFKSVMGSCLFSLKNKLYFEYYNEFNFAKLIFYINTIDSSFSELATIIDQEKYDMLEDNPEDWIIFGGAFQTPSLGDLRGLGSDVNTLAQIRNLTDGTRFIKMAFYTEIYAPVLPIGDSVCVFNHPNNCIDFYDAFDSLTGSIPIDYHIAEKANQLITFGRAFAPSNKWLNEIYTDPIGRKAYTIFRNINGTKDLINIDLATGKTQYMLTIPFPYVQKIQVYKNYLYFVYKGWGNNQKKKLFRQKIF